MTDTTVNLPPVATTSGQQLDGESLLIGGITVIRERNRLAGAAATDVAAVSSSALATFLVGALASLTSGMMYQGTSPWLTQAATSGGAQPVAQSSTPWVIVASSTGGAQPVVQSATPWVVVSSTTGGAIAVSSLTSATVFQGTSPWTVVASTTGGNAPVFLGNTLPLSVVASTTGGNVPVFLGNTLPLLVVASTTGGAQQVIQSATPWTVVASTTGGAIAISTQVSLTSLTSGTVFQGVTPWLVVASTTGGAVPIGIVRATQPTALADGAVAQAILDTKGRAVVTLSQVRQLITQKTLQVTLTGETVLFAGTSGTYHDLMALIISSATSNTVGAACTIKDSSGGVTQFILNTGSSGPLPTVLDFDPPWKHSTATSTGSAWTVNFSIAGTYNVSAQFSDWTS